MRLNSEDRAEAVEQLKALAAKLIVVCEYDAALKAIELLKAVSDDGLPF